LEMYY